VDSYLGGLSDKYSCLSMLLSDLLHTDRTQHRDIVDARPIDLLLDTQTKNDVRIPK